MDNLSERLGQSKITRRYQITLPPNVRQILGISEGEYIVFYIDKNSQMVYLRAAKLVEK